MMATVYDALFDAGEERGLRDAGYHTLDALRIEAGRRAFASELGSDETPFEAGLGFAVKIDKGDFIGAAALRQCMQAPLRKRLALFSLNDPDVFAWGGEVILHDGIAVGEVSSAGYSRLAGRALVMGYLRGSAAAAVGSADSRFALDIAGARQSVTYLPRPFYPPAKAT
jgi:4-methylaminobutanoate oxidase (formaldehyde-forming)